MSLDLVRRHPLEGYVAAGSAAQPIDHLEMARDLALCHILTVAGQETAAAAALADDEAISFRFVGPGEWLAVSTTKTPDGLYQHLADRLGKRAHLFDQSEGRILLRLSGPNIRAILSRGVAVDLHPSAFALGGSVNMLCGHVSVNLARTGENAFELIVMRSFCRALVDDLSVMGRAFDLSAAFSV